jgi:hypothetical protein
MEQDSAEPGEPEEERPSWEPPPAVWSAEQTETALAAVLSLGIPEPMTVFSDWQSMFGGVDPGCPGGELYGISSTASGCVSESGWLYAGMASYSEFTAEIERAEVLSVDGYIIAPDDRTFIGGGTVGMMRINDADSSAWIIEMEGSFGLSSSASPWLSQLPSLALFGEGGFRGDHRQLSLLGGWQVDGQAIYLDIGLDSDCEGLTGQVQLRDPSGLWHSVELECAACGPVSYADGPASAEICIDMAPIEVFMDQIEATL